MSAWVDRPLRLPQVTHPSIVDHGLDDEGVSGLDHEALFAELCSRPETLALVLHRSSVLIDAAGRLALIAAAELPALRRATSEHSPPPLRLYLGRVHTAEGIPDDGVLVAAASRGKTAAQSAPVVALVLGDADAQQVEVGKWAQLRDVMSVLDPHDVGLATRAVALANWHHTHEYSSSTGQLTSLSEGGWVRIDPSTGSQHFPRTDPAVIIAVTDDADRLLLASNMAWDERVFSLIAGFVDPGESLEEAVLREVREESGYLVGEPRYLGSQPWPFPASLMLGFHATIRNGHEAGRADGVEIRALRWFTRAELRDAEASGEVVLPGHASISRAIIDAWQRGAEETP